nr:hypothetical protein BaRGS_005652 [Batillaria attramentaria]
MSGITRVLYDVGDGGPPADVAEFVWKSVQEEKCTSIILLPSIITTIAQRLTRQDDVASDRLLLGDWKPDVILTDPDKFVDHEMTPAPGVLLKVVGEGEDKPLGPGQVGNILVKRRGMFTGYLHDPAATAAAFTSDGFFRTGDVGKMDARGHLILEGRGGDAIMRGANVLYPAWLEARIRACPGVSDVVVVGVPDPHVNEEVCACVVLTSDEVSVEHVRQVVEKDIITSADDPLSPRPRYYVTFQSFPMTDTHKPRRKLIKQQAAQRFRSPE